MGVIRDYEEENPSRETNKNGCNKRLQRRKGEQKDQQKLALYETTKKKGRKELPTEIVVGKYH